MSTTTSQQPLKEDEEEEDEEQGEEFEFDYSSDEGKIQEDSKRANSETPTVPEKTVPLNDLPPAGQELILTKVSLPLTGKSIILCCQF